MFRFLFRLAGAAALAVAVILAVLDATRTVAAGRLVLTPLGRSWADASPATLEAAAGFTRSEIAPRLWDGFEASVLAAPGALVFFALALALFFLGRRYRRRPGRLVFQP